MEEIWKDIPNYEGLYQASNLGEIRNYKTKNILAKQIKTNYYYVHLYKHNKLKYARVHRIIAQTFIPNPDNLPQINHKDENKLNNCVDNLEWCTAKYNFHYSYKRRIKINKNYKFKLKKVIQKDKEGKTIKIYNSIIEASKENNIQHSHISAVCKGKRKSAGNYLWEYS